MKRVSHHANTPLASEARMLSRRGGIYQLGRHRLMCGDATRDEVAELAIPAKGKKRTPVLELTPGQLAAVRHAMAETGYLRELGAAYQTGEMAT